MVRVKEEQIALRKSGVDVPLKLKDSEVVNFVMMSRRVLELAKISRV